MLTAKQLENCQRAIALLEQTPEHLIDLDTITCGSTHCALGWIATDKYFNRLGICLSRSGSLCNYDYEDISEIFGESTTYRATPLSELFNSGHDSPHDTLAPYGTSHKQLAIRRFELHIQRHRELAILQF